MTERQFLYIIYFPCQYICDKIAKVFYIGTIVGFLKVESNTINNQKLLDIKGVRKYIIRRRSVTL
jgi:hypothetical protein